MKKSAYPLVLGAWLLSLAAVTQAEVVGNPAAGKAKSSSCAGCHGIPGYRTAYPQVYNVPKLGGQHAGYIVKALQAYKAGERNFPTMQAVAESLSDQDMADLAAYYAATGRK